MSTPAPQSTPPPALDQGAYDVLRQRLGQSAQELASKLAHLAAERKRVFGGIEPALAGSDRFVTPNACQPRDLVAVGGRILVGFRVQFGLKTDIQPEDLFALYDFKPSEQGLESGGAFLPAQLSTLLGDAEFRKDFSDLFKFYKTARFGKFFRKGPHLFVKFHVGRPGDVDDFKSFKFAVEPFVQNGVAGEKLVYLGNRSDHELRYPEQREVPWVRATRDDHRAGDHPHVSIRDQVFVECIGGDLTIKVENNTASGKGIYAEPVDDADQRLDDAEIEYAVHGPIILLKVRPYKEKAFRHFIFNSKTKEVHRCDAVGAACIPLPEDHGIVFPGGISLASGRHQEFLFVLEHGQQPVFESKVAAQSGEDFLYVFYDRPGGTYSLFFYNIVTQKVETPILCHGQAFMEDGTLVFMKAHETPQKTHAAQLWRTPMVGAGWTPPKEDTSSFLHKIGPRDLVRGLSDGMTVLEMARRPDPYELLYVDLARAAGEAAEAHFWLSRPEVGDVAATLKAVRETAAAAVAEYEKVRAARRHAREKTEAVEAQAKAAAEDSRTRICRTMADFVAGLLALREARAEAVSLREVKYADPARAKAIEEELAKAADVLGEKAAVFLAKPDALSSYDADVELVAQAAGGAPSVLETKKAEAAAGATAKGLEALVETISNLKIEDAAARTALTEKVSTVFANLNAARSRLKARRETLAKQEGEAEFGSRLRLLEQAVASRLDLCDTPEACEQHGAKVMVQVEELEGRFAEFEAFAPILADKRTEVSAAFEARRVQLVERRTKKAEALVQAAERLFKGLAGRLEALKDGREVHAFLAGDPMAEKARSLAGDLEALGDRVRSDMLHTRFKTLREETLRKLADKADLQEGEGLMRLGKHVFSIHGQAPELTTAMRGGNLCLHVTGTRYFEPVSGAEAQGVEACRAVWDRESAAESPSVYRGEFLAFLAFMALREPARRGEAPEEAVRAFMNQRLQDGFVKGVHDADALALLAALREMDAQLDGLRHGPEARALAALFWQVWGGPEKAVLGARIGGAGAAQGVFAALSGGREAKADLEARLSQFAKESGVLDPEQADEAAACLFEALAKQTPIAISPEASALYESFLSTLEGERAQASFHAAMQSLADAPLPRFRLAMDWAKGFLSTRAGDEAELAPELALLLFEGARPASARVGRVSPKRKLEGMKGAHPVIGDGGAYDLHFHRFTRKLAGHAAGDAPAFERFAAARKALVAAARVRFKVEEFTPKVLTSFVRNQLVNEVFLPLIGDNLAKQIGAAGAAGRSDRMGLLLLISPPGYGKTTLVEYVAARLGLVYVKINGPVLGHGVTSLDPAAAPDVASRREVERLNAAFEMGDNVLLILDDIQHLNPEFLQKFISLCDGTRRIEGVWKGEPRVYDLRGRKFAVVMAGNPYTESGEKFKIPDMLANRADVFNLGDMASSHPEAFRRSYIENALSGHPALAVLSGRPQKDIQALIASAETFVASGERRVPDLESALSASEAQEASLVLERLVKVRDIVMRMNQEYIRSAGQDNAHRTEPPFLLQGSYRNMGRLAARVSGLMNDRELMGLITASYEQEAQTLTGGTQSNLLKFREILGLLTDEQKKRWEELKASFRRVNAAKSLGGDAGAAAVAQLAALGEGVAGIGQAIAKAQADRSADKSAAMLEASAAKVEGRLAGIEEALRQAQAAAAQAPAPIPDDQKIHITNHIPEAFLFILKEQFRLMQAWMKPAANTKAAAPAELVARLEVLSKRYEEIIGKLEKGGETEGVEEPQA